MGEVHRAYDPLLQREVALKLIRVQDHGRPGSDTAQARLVGEARAMARINHPNVVDVYDVGLIGDELFVAMELVSGGTLRRLIESSDTSRSEVLRALIEAGRGLAAAHRAGLVHHDFKPDNVLVSEDGRVLVTDFGLARHIGEERGELPGGTPAYAAPEQREGRVGDVRSDQYSYCVVFYEVIEDAQLGACCRTTRRALPRMERALRRGMSEDPDQRWPSMHALLTELERARRPLPLRVAVAGLAVFAAGSAAAMAVSEPATDVRCNGAAAELGLVWGPVKHEKMRASFADSGLVYAAATWDRVAPRIESYANAWAQQHTEVCRATEVHHTQSEEMRDLKMACLQQAKYALGSKVDVLASGQASAIRRADALIFGLPELVQCDDGESLWGRAAPVNGVGLGRVEQALARAYTLIDTALYGEADAVLGALLSDEIVQREDSLRARTQLRVGQLRRFQGRPGDASTQLRSAFRLALGSRDWATAFSAAVGLAATAVLADKPEWGVAYTEVALGLSHAASPEEIAHLHQTRCKVLSAQGKHAEAVAECRVALAGYGGSDANLVDVATGRAALGNALYAEGRYADAATEHRAATVGLTEALGHNHPTTAISRTTLGNSLLKLQEYERAEVEFRGALEVFATTQEPYHENVLATRIGLANALTELERFPDAEREMKEILAVARLAPEPSGYVVASAQNNLGRLYYRLYRYAEAKRAHHDALESALAAFGPTHKTVVTLRLNLALVLLKERHFRGAEGELRAALLVLTKAPNFLKEGRVQVALGEALQGQGRDLEAIQEFRAGLTRLGEEAHPSTFRLARGRRNLALSLLAVGQGAEAVALLEDAWLGIAALPAKQGPRAATAFALARALGREGPSRGRAAELAQLALSIYETLEPAFARERGQIATWLAPDPLKGRARKTGPQADRSAESDDKAGKD